MSSGKLRDFLRRYPITANAVLALAIGVPFAVGGSFMLRAEVSHHWLSASAAPWANWPVSTSLLFALNFYGVWRNQHAERRQAASRWLVKASLHTGITMSMYQAMVVLIGWPYLTVSISMYALSPISFGIDWLWTFARSQKLQMAVR